MRERQRLRQPIGELTRTGVPARHVVFDTEARLQYDRGVQVQTWELAAAEYFDLSRRGSERHGVIESYDDPGRLWERISAYCRPHQRLIVWAHNLGYDLRISRALELLPRLGWILDGIMLESGTAWAAWSTPKGGNGRSLLCCDLTSWLPVSLARIAGDLGEGRPSVQWGAADRQELAERCRRDVHITARAVRELLEFIRVQDLGAFKPTGSGQGFSAWRRRFYTHPVWVHNDPDALEAERDAIWPGRCEAWRHGEIRGQELTEWDLELAHAHIGAECAIPVELNGIALIRNRLDLERHIRHYAVLARCVVTTREPVVPCRHGDRVLWPVGTFETVLWDPELRLAWDTGAGVRVLRAWSYQRAPAIAAASRWIIEQLRGGTDCTSPLAQRLVKHWSRTLVGRFALRYRRWELDGAHPRYDLGSSFELDAGSDDVRELLHVGHQVFELAELTEAAVSAPQVTGWVVSECRRRLWELMRGARLSDVVYVDTDSIVATAAGSARLRRLSGRGRAFSLRPKGCYQQARILGPRQLELGPHRRYAGVPIKAIETGDLELAGEVWSTMRDAARAGTLDRVLVTPRLYTLRGVDHRRRHNPDGTTSAVEINGGQK